MYVRKIFSGMLCTKKIVQVLKVKHNNREDQRKEILCKKILEITAISRINKTTSTWFRNQKGLTVGACHDIRDLSYDNYLYI